MKQYKLMDEGITRRAYRWYYRHTGFFGKLFGNKEWGRVPCNCSEYTFGHSSFCLGQTFPTYSTASIAFRYNKQTKDQLINQI